MLNFHRELRVVSASATQGRVVSFLLLMMRKNKFLPGMLRQSSEMFNCVLWIEPEQY